MYRIWSKIAEITKKNPLLGLLLATFNLGDMGITSRLILAFPECFSEAKPEDAGPIPISVLKREARKEATREGSDSRLEYLENCLYSFGILQKHDIPYFEYATDPHSEKEYKIPPLPKEVDASAKTGTAVGFLGTKGIVAENNESCAFMVIVPIECIDPNS